MFSQAATLETIFVWPTGRKKYFVMGLLVLCLTTAGIHLYAQTSTTGDIVGSVSDPAGSVIPNAKVVLTSIDTRSVTSTTTDAGGLYRFPLLKPGNYSVEASASGFQLVSRNVAVTLGSSITVNLNLAISSQQETVEVTSGTVGVQTEDANLETNFDATQIAVLPNPGNDLSAVALTSPGVVMNTTGGSTFGGGNYEFFGLPSNSNVFTYDGANDNDPYFNINNSGATNLTLGLNDVEQTSVVTNGYSGQYGGLAGANINYVSKSGTNNFHGNAEYWWNGRALNANNFFLSQQGSPRQFVNANQYATSIGGPIKKDKAFFFVDYEGIRLLIPSLLSVNVPSQQFENAVISNLNTVSPASIPFYNQLFGLWNGAPGISRAQNILPGGGCSNVTTLAGTAFGASNPCVLQFQGGTSQATNDYLIVGRYDQNIGKNDKVFVRVQHESGQQATYTDPINPIFDASSAQPEWQSQVSETHTFGNNKVNNLVASMQWYSALFNIANPLAEAQALPETLALGDGSLFNLNNDGSFFPQGRNVTQYGIVDDFSWTRGKHNFRLGINFRRDDVSDHNFTFTTPFAEAVTLNDFAFGGVAPVPPGAQPGGSIFQQAFPVNSDVPISLYQLGWYVSDEVRVTPGLKLTLSMRFDHISNPVCQTNCFQSVNGAFQNLNPAAPVNQALVTGLHNAFPSVTSIVYEPKVGFAWSPFGAKNTVIRGGIGIFSDAIPTGAIDDVLTNAPNDPSFNVFNGALAPAAPGSLNSQAVAANAGFRTNFANGGAVAPFNFFNPGPVKVPRYDEWDLEIQHSLGWNTIVSAKYVGNHGEHEELTNPALNAFSPTGFGGLPTAVPNDEFGVVGQTQNVANSNYNGLVLSVSHSMNGGFQFQASYTYSHALDEISNNSLNPFGVNTFTNVDVVTPLNPFNPRLNYGNADYDVRQSFVMNYVWSNSFRHLTSWGPDALMKGWTFSGTIFKHTGFPYSIYSSNATGILQQSLFGSGAAATATAVLANVTGNPNVNCGASAAQLANPCYSEANFSDPTTTFSDQRRNQFRGPGYFDTDFNVEKSFAVPRWESANVSVGARFFNFFNHPNFGFPNTNIDSKQFGQITSAVSQPTTIYGSGLQADASPRVIELQAKFVF